MSKLDSQAQNDGTDTLNLAVGRLSWLVYVVSSTCAVMAITIMVLVWWLIHTHPVPVGIGPHGEVIQLVPLDVAYIDDSRLEGMAEETLRLSFAHDFENYPQTINALAPRYTSDGFFSLKNAIAPFISQMKTNRYVMSLSIDRPPIVVDQQVISGTVTWFLQAVVYINRQGSNDRVPPTRYNVQMVMTRVPLIENLAGALTASVNLSPA
jgi:hypothetical protein